ncbi:MAG: right-handed parallel beta-helix repeat-containing protein [Methanobrevibacter sp.]|uniref:right-handed parallel beta-helix repeat-containing protein n=1 Tax=Methanobrevibacter sp. TaxID=66852 RepID=UPI0025D6F2C3|nr:right-handed parallel beta-helix repeat-containing protein [Methanobrevibacter sp.]MBR0270679.1 right-handed parallel beta-helix repeat-containing protein [Methanobrevibacter sp.]
MIKKFNIFIILLLLLFVSVGSVCAADDVNETVGINEVNDDNGEILSASEFTVTSSNYTQYFSSQSGELISSVVNEGDTIILSGDFSSKNFTFNKKVNIVGSGGTISGGIITLKSGASGSNVSNLKIMNNGEYMRGIYLNGASYCTISDNEISNIGVSAYPICLNEAHYNNIINNKLETSEASYGHGTRSTSVIVLGTSNNNYIAGNDIRVADANAIYLSSYGGGDFKGGESFNNIIFNNTITYTVNATSWAYGIQMMGGNNTADSNRIYGAYRGISSSSTSGNKAINNYVQVSGTDFNTGLASGGDYGIALSSQAVVRNNTVIGAFVGAGVSVAGDDSIIENNFINSSKGYGITAQGNDIKIVGNKIYTTSSAGIDQQGKYDGIVVDRNTIVSDSGIGVLLSKSSKTKYPSNITITNNRITTSNQYMINAADADKNSNTITNNTGDGKIMTPAGEVDPTVPDFVFNGTTYYVTPDNYHNYIDADGNLKNDFVHDGDILYFTGLFEDKEILVSSSIKMVGMGALFTNTTIMVTSDSVWIENISIYNQGANRLDAWGIFVADTQIVKIVNNNIIVYDPVAAYSIYIYKSSKVFVENNVLMSHGDSLTYPLLGYGAENCEFVNNTIECIGTGQIHAFEDSKDLNVNSSELCIGQCIGQCLGDVLSEHCLDGTNIVPEIYRTYGILMIKSSNNTVSGNKVDVTSLVNESLVVNSTNSLVGIDFYYDCDNNIIKDNVINVEGNDNYLYGAGALAQSTGQFSSSTAKNNTFVANNITVTGSNVVEGFIFGQGCTDSNVIDNNVKLNTNRTAYGITLEMSNNSTITGNNITMDAKIAYAIEAFQSNGNTIEDNTISGKGSIISAIAGVKSSNNVIQNNNITCDGDGSDLGFFMKDVVNAPNSGIYLEGISNNNMINENEIVTAIGYPVVFSAEATGNTVTNNYLKGSEGSGDDGVNASSANTVKDNYGLTFDNLQMNDTTVQYAGDLTVVLETGSEANGANVLFTLNNVIIANTTVEDGKAVAAFKLNKNYNVGDYTVTATLTKAGFKSGSITANVQIVKSEIVVDVDDVVAKAGDTALFKATVTDVNNNTVSGVTVKFYRNIIYIGSATTDANGVAATAIKIPVGLSNKYTIIATVDNSNNYKQGSGDATLTISDDARQATKLTDSNITMTVKDGTRLSTTLTDLAGNPISGANVIITLNGVPYTKTTDASGVASIALNLVSGEYTAQLLFNGTDNYAPSQAEANILIKPTLFANDFTKMFRNATRYVVDVMVDGAGVPNIGIDLNINGVIYERTTDASGRAGLNINLAPGKYIITAERKDTHEKLSTNIEVLSLFSENNDVEMFFRNGTRYTVKVTKQDGTVAGANETVTFNINGVMYERLTDENGVAGLNINLRPGDYIITAMYQGCMISNNIKVKPILYANDLTKTYGNSEPFTVELVDGQGNPFADQNITFNINGVMYNRVTNESGIAKLNINLAPGVYIITSMYEKLSAAISNTVTVRSS